MLGIMKKLRSAKRPFIIAIESSCDDTCLAVLNSRNEVIFQLNSSQKRLHQPFGGIVPQVAAHGHRTSFNKFLQNKQLQQIIQNKSVSVIAVTAGPGIGNCLNIGFEFATHISSSNNIPLLPVNHLLGHLLSAGSISENKFPRLSLIVSGGNTQMVFSKSSEYHQILGITIDDALGEALDKSARLLNCDWAEAGGLGNELEKLAFFGEPIQLNINTLGNYKDPLSFSFSGLKTALKLFISENIESIAKKEDLAATIQEALFQHIVERVKNCFEVLKRADFMVRTFSVIGGVASNKYLRSCLESLCSKYGVEIIAPPLCLCTDNAVMIGVAANKMISSDINFPEIKRVNPNWNLEELAINKSILD